MQTTLAGVDKSNPTDDESCDECPALPAGWPCADCFIAGDAEIDA